MKTVDHPFTDFDHYAVPLDSDVTPVEYYCRIRDWSAETGEQVMWCESYGGSGSSSAMRPPAR